MRKFHRWGGAGYRSARGRSQYVMSTPCLSSTTLLEGDAVVDDVPAVATSESWRSASASSPCGHTSTPFKAPDDQRQVNFV